MANDRLTRSDSPPPGTQWPDRPAESDAPEQRDRTDRIRRENRDNPKPEAHVGTSEQESTSQGSE